MMSTEDREAWRRIRAKVEQAAQEYNHDFGHDLCPWIFDATELRGALDYIDTVVTFEGPNEK